jgi:hypothetical protein
MRTNSTSRSLGLVLAVFTLAVSLPELARAQQGGLFPNLPIRRQRVPCDQEDPIYKVYKHQYYGYHPTCWHPFPKGWGCPSPERPDREKSFKETPLQSPEPLEGDQPPDDGMQPTQPGARPAVPPLPPAGRSPFEDTPDMEKPGAAPGAAPGRGRTPLPTTPGDPFDLDKPARPATPPQGAQGGAAGPGAASNGPELSAPAEQPGPIQGTRTSQNELFDGPDSRADDGPILALPKVDLPPVNDPGVPFGTVPPPPAASTDSNVAAANPNAPRRGFLSGLFSNLGLNWTRR